VYVCACVGVGSVYVANYICCFHPAVNSVLIIYLIFVATFLIVWFLDVSCGHRTSLDAIFLPLHLIFIFPPYMLLVSPGSICLEIKSYMCVFVVAALLRNNIHCVGWGVKLLTHSLIYCDLHCRLLRQLWDSVYEPCQHPYDTQEFCSATYNLCHISRPTRVSVLVQTLFTCDGGMLCGEVFGNGPSVLSINIVHSGYSEMCLRWKEYFT